MDCLPLGALIVGSRWRRYADRRLCVRVDAVELCMCAACVFRIQTRVVMYRGLLPGGINFACVRKYMRGRGYPFLQYNFTLQCR